MPAAVAARLDAALADLRRGEPSARRTRVTAGVRRSRRDARRDDWRGAGRGRGRPRSAADLSRGAGAAPAPAGARASERVAAAVAVIAAGASVTA